VVESFLKLMPHWLTHSFEIMGGILPALGFAITIMVIGKRACCRGLSADSLRCCT
jgi:D-glucosaminate-specific PTS system IIC component